MFSSEILVLFGMTCAKFFGGVAHQRHRFALPKAVLKATPSGKTFGFAKHSLSVRQRHHLWCAKRCQWHNQRFSPKGLLSAQPLSQRRFSPSGTQIVDLQSSRFAKQYLLFFFRCVRGITLGCAFGKAKQWHAQLLIRWKYYV